MTKHSHIRVVSGGIMGHETRVFYVDREGNETDISDVVTDIEFNVRMSVGEVNKATLSVIKAKFDARALAEQIDRELHRMAVTA